LNPDPYVRTYQHSIAPFKAFTAQQYLKLMRIQGIFFKYDASPGNDHEAPQTYAEIVEHVIGNAGEYGHCNIALDAWPDEGFVNKNIDTTNSAQHGEFLLREGTIWQRIQEIARIENYVAYFDKSNTFNYIPRSMFLSPLPDPVLDITSGLLLEPLRITPRNTEEVWQIRIQGSTPGGLQISGAYPTDRGIGPVIVEAGFKAADNSAATTIAERRYRYDTRPYSVLALLPGAVGLMVDLLDRVSITYTSSADGVTWSAEKFWIEEIQVDIMEDFTAQTTLTLEGEN
jgi:hypothetical protein